MPRTRNPRLVTKTLLAALILLAVAAAYWFGMVPNRWSPLPALTLEKPGQWFVDARLSSLRFDPQLCRQILKAPHIEATPIADQPFEDHCGWTNAVRLTSAGGVKFPVDKLTCETAAALALWLEYDVQPASLRDFGQRVVGLKQMGTYSCRTIIGNAMWKNVPSQHASANAIDIGGFTLADGRHISVAHDWKGNGKEASFLREIHQRACRLFRVALSPDFNAAHHDHFHLDRGFLMRCK